MVDLGVYLVGTGGLGAETVHALRGLDGIALCGGAVRDPGGKTAAALASVGIDAALLPGDLSRSIEDAAPDLVVVVGDLRDGLVAGLAVSAERGALVVRVEHVPPRLVVRVLNHRGELAWERHRYHDGTAKIAAVTRRLVVDALSHAVAAVRDGLAVRPAGQRGGIVTALAGARLVAGD